MLLWIIIILVVVIGFVLWMRSRSKGAGEEMPSQDSMADEAAPVETPSMPEEAPQEPSAPESEPMEQSSEMTDQPSSESSSEERPM